MDARNEDLTDFIDVWEAFGAHLKQHSGNAAHSLNFFVPDANAAYAPGAPCAVLTASDDSAVSRPIVDALIAANRPTFQANLGDVLAQDLDTTPGGVDLMAALERSPPNTAVIVILDSHDAGSRSTVEQFIQHMRSKDCLWFTAANRPRLTPALTFLDKGLDADLVYADQVVGNLSYYPNIHSGQIDEVVSGVVGKPEGVEARLFSLEETSVPPSLDDLSDDDYLTTTLPSV
jgi:hypothetical protein